MHGHLAPQKWIVFPASLASLKVAREGRSREVSFAAPGNFSHGLFTVAYFCL